MNSGENIKVVSGSVSFTGLLQVAFVVLKLCGVINWSWWWVLLPTIISIGFAVILIAISFIIAFIYYKRENTKKYEKYEEDEGDALD